MAVDPRTGRLYITFTDNRADDRRPGNTYVAELAERAPEAFSTRVVSQARSHPDESLFLQAGVPGCQDCAHLPW
jgi:hypothetical protein